MREHGSRGVAIRDRLVPIAALVFCLLAFFTFFSIVSPAYIFDWDDWGNISWMRSGFPVWGLWNPTKVLPEVLMSSCGMAGGLLLNHFVNDYVESVKLVCAGTFSLFLTAYFAVFYLMLRKRFDAGRVVAVGWTAVFAFLHFVTFPLNADRGIYLLYSPSVTTFFNYTIPNVCNAAFVMLLISGYGSIMHEKGHILAKGFMVFGAYLCVYSNLFSSVVLVAYVGACLVCDLVAWIRSASRPPLLSYVREHVLELLIVAFWLVSLVFEANGGRATSLTKGPESMSFVSLVSYAGQMLVRRLFDTRRLIAALALVALVAWIVWTVRHREESRRLTSELVRIAIAIALSAVYLVLLSAKTIPANTYRPDVIYCVLFFVFLGTALSLGELVKRHPAINACLPFAVFLLACAVPIINRGFLPIYELDVSPATVKAIDQDVVKQVKEAADRGDDVVRVGVPHVTDDQNWPLRVTKEGEPTAVGVTLYRHGVINDPIEVYFVVDTQKNAEFGVPEPTGSEPQKVSGIVLP